MVAVAGKIILSTINGWLNKQEEYLWVHLAGGAFQYIELCNALERQFGLAQISGPIPGRIGWMIPRISLPWARQYGNLSVGTSGIRSTCNMMLHECSARSRAEAVNT